MTTPPNRSTLGTALLALALVAGGGFAALATAPANHETWPGPGPLALSSDDPTPPAATLPLAKTALDGCTEQLEMWTIPAGVTRGLLPEGFEPATADPAGQAAIAFYLGFECQSLEETDGPAAALLGGLLVEPPSERSGDADQHAIVFEAWSNSAEMRESFRNWSWGTVHAADVDVEVPISADAARTGHLTTEWAGHTLRIASEVAGPTHRIEDFTMRVFGLGSGGVVATTVDWSFGPGRSQGPGTATFVSDRPSPVPTEPGLAFHAWGEDYGYTFELADGNETDEDDGESDPEVPDEWPPLTSATIRPGVQVAGGCTANFVFRTPDNATLYLGTASHCLTGDEVGDTVSIAGGQAEGTIAYCSWGTIAGTDRCPSRTIDVGPLRLTDPRDELADNDFALIAVDATDRSGVHPAVIGSGGPTGLAETASPGDRALVHGNSSLNTGPAWDLRPKEGYVIERDQWTTDLALVAPGVPGDSGSPVLDAAGGAVGLVVQGGSEGTVATNLDPAVSFAEEKGGLEVELVTWELFESADLPELPLDSTGGHGLRVR